MIIKCVTCGKEVNKLPSQIKRSKTGNSYCSKTCAVTNNNKLFRIGENHPNYTDGVASYRKKALRAKKSCEDCGNRDERVLEVHHLDENRRNNLIENLIVLCANCHLIRHYENEV